MVCPEILSPEVPPLSTAKMIKDNMPHEVRLCPLHFGRKGYDYNICKVPILYIRRDVRIEVLFGEVLAGSPGAEDTTEQLFDVIRFRFVVEAAPDVLQYRIRCTAVLCGKIIQAPGEQMWAKRLGENLSKRFVDQLALEKS